MSKIPVCDKETMEAADEKGRVYSLKYLTEIDNQVRYLELTRKEEGAIAAATEEVEKDFPQSVPGNVSDVEDAKKLLEERKRAVRLAAWMKVQEAREKDTRKYLEEIDEYVAIFVDNPPRLRLYEKFPLYRLIQKNIGVLTGLTGEEIKN
jgi:hypothetical protein